MFDVVPCFRLASTVTYMCICEHYTNTSVQQWNVASMWNVICDAMCYVANVGNRPPYTLDY